MTAVSEATGKPDVSAGRLGSARTATALLWGSLAAGAILRLARWIHWRALWLDEIYLANSLRNRSLHDLLFKPLDDWQAAPPGFLVLVHSAVRALGTGERPLRLVSLAFGLASLPLMLAVARRALGAGGAVLAMASFSFLGPLIYYGNELKPYSCDVAISLAVTLATLRWMDRPSFRRSAIAAAVGATGIFFSYPAVFVLAGAGIWMLWNHRRSSDLGSGGTTLGAEHSPLPWYSGGGMGWGIRLLGGKTPTLALPRSTRGGKERGFALAICLVWGVVFATDYLIFLRPLTHGEAHPHLVQYWAAQDAFMPRSPFDAGSWMIRCLTSIARSPGAMWLDYPDAALIGLIVGIAVALRNRGNLLLVLAPLPLVLAASASRQYPFADRLALFFVPQYLLLLAAATESLWTNLAGKTAAIAIAALVAIPSASRAVGFLFSPPGREESLPAYRWVAQQWQPGDVVYLTHFAEPSFRYYQSLVHWPSDLESSKALYVQPSITEPRQILDDVKPLAGRHRIWLILIHAEGGELDVHQFTVAAFNDIGHPVREHDEPGACACLYDCSALEDARR
ncbi:MAG: glycosyltransferase family 39 protein [Tepidisphaeraceae bacterium]|jgi:hypothetical protein